jgi:Flp pilus assembly protein TadG
MFGCSNETHATPDEACQTGVTPGQSNRTSYSDGSATGKPWWTPARQRNFRAFRGCQRGVAALEFALLGIPLCLLIFGGIGASAAFMTWGMMQGSAQYGARVMATGLYNNNINGAITALNTTSTAVSCTNAAITATKVEFYACTNLPPWAVFTVTTVEDCTVPSVTVTLSTSMSSAVIINVMSFFSGTLAAKAVVMKEGTCP